MVDETLLLYLPYSWKVTFGVLMAIVSFLATIENGIVLVTIFNYQILHTTSNKILSSLAISDFLTGITVALLFALQLLNPDLINNPTVDLMRRYLSTFLVGASIFTLGFISYDRSLHLRLLNRYQLSRRKLYLTLLMCWLIPLLVPLLRKVDKSESAYSATIVIVAAIVFAGIICCYCLVICALHKEQKVSSINFKGERRAVKTVFVILTIFAITIIPICIHHALNVCKALPKEQLSKSYIIGMLLCVMNSAINPIIYYLRTPYLKKYVKRLLGIWKPDVNSSEMKAENSLSTTTIK